MLLEPDKDLRNRNAIINLLLKKNANSAKCVCSPLF